MAKLRVNPTASQAFLRGYSRSEAGILLLVRIWLWTPLIASAALSLVVLGPDRLHRRRILCAWRGCHPRCWHHRRERRGR